MVKNYLHSVPGYFGELINGWQNIVGTIFTIVGFVGVFTTDPLTIERNLCLAIGVVAFLLVNSHIYYKYKAKEGKLTIKFNSGEVCFDNTGSVWDNESRRPKRVNYGGVPGDVYIDIPLWIENSGERVGRPKCEFIVKESELPSAFIFDEDSLPNGLILLSENNIWIEPKKPVPAHWRINLLVANAQSDHHYFAKRLHDADTFKLVVRYKTERMDNSENEWSKPIVIQGSFDSFKKNLLSAWKDIQGLETVIDFYKKLG